MTSGRHPSGKWQVFVDTSDSRHLTTREGCVGVGDKGRGSVRNVSRGLAPPKKKKKKKI